MRLTRSRKSTILITMPILPNSHPECALNQWTAIWYVSKFMSNKQSSVWLALPFPLDTIEASDEVSDQFQTLRRDMFGMQVCRLVFFGIQELYVYRSHWQKHYIQKARKRNWRRKEKQNKEPPSKKPRKLEVPALDRCPSVLIISHIQGLTRPPNKCLKPLWN